MRGFGKAALVAALFGTAAMPASAEVYFFRSKALVSPPVEFSFPAAVAAGASRVTESPVVALSGFRGRTASVSPAGAQYQICGVADCSDRGDNWASAPSPVPSDAAWARVRLTSATFGQVATATLAVGGISAQFSVTSPPKDVDPDPITPFASVADAAPGAAALSPVRTLSGHDGVAVSVAGGEFQVCVDAACSSGGAWTTSLPEVARDSTIRLRVAAGADGTTKTATLTYGTRTASWSVTAKAPLSACTSSTVSGAGCLIGSEPYASIGGGKFVAPCDEGMSWNGTTCSGTRLTFSYASASMSDYSNGVEDYGDGYGNTTKLVASRRTGYPFEAAERCRAKGSQWYLPATNEFVAMNGLAASVAYLRPNAVTYWSSTQHRMSGYAYVTWVAGRMLAYPNQPIYYDEQTATVKQNVRCARTL